MGLNYKRLDKHIQVVNERNINLEVKTLLGVSVKKIFIPSIANTVGTDFKKYKIVKKHQFVYIPDTSRRGEKIGIAMLDSHDSALVSQAYTVFEIIDDEALNAEYLMMWFRRPEFDRYARFKSHGTVREIFDWDEVCDIELPIPSIEKQREIVKEYNTIVNRITLNETLNQKLEDSAQALYKHWFVDFEFPNADGKPYKSSGGEMVFNEELDMEIPKGWESSQLKSICSKIGSGSTPRGGKEAYHSEGISLIRSLNIHDYQFLHRNLAFINETQAKKLNNVSLEDKDILLNITGASVARCTIVPASVLPARVNQHVAIIRLSEEVGTPYYFMSVLCSSKYKRQLLGVSESGSTRQAITKAEIEDLYVLLPENNIREFFESKIKILFEHREITFNEGECLKNLVSLILARIVKTA
jgi:type I restriction enzyme S subunit